jgi:vacuolar-type H+-ATPase subunit H
MTSTIEETVKALVQFESELDRARADVSEAKRRTTNDASAWAEAAKSSAISRAQDIASRRVAQAKEEAEAEAKEIREKGEADLRAFEASISKYRLRAAVLAASRLLGESK